MVARYGGEEIIAMLFGADRAARRHRGRARCSRRWRELGIAHGGSATRPYVTVSVGVTTVEPGGDYSHEHAVRLADIALYVEQGARPRRLVVPRAGGARPSIARRSC